MNFSKVRDFGRANHWDGPGKPEGFVGGFGGVPSQQLRLNSPHHPLHGRSGSPWQPDRRHGRWKHQVLRLICC